MNFLNPYSASLAFGFVLLIVPLSAATAASKSTGHRVMLTAWVANAFCLCVPSMLGFAGFFTNYPEWRYLPVTVFTLSGPLLVGYLLSLIRSGLPKYIWWSFCIPLLEFGYRLALFYPTLEAKSDWLRNWHTPIIDGVLTLAGCLMLLAAMVYLVREVDLYRRYLAAKTSNAYDFSYRLVTGALASIFAVSAAWVAVDFYEFAGGLLTHKQEFPLYMWLIVNSLVLCQITLIAAHNTLPTYDPAYAKEVEGLQLESAPDTQLIQAFIDSSLHLQGTVNLERASSQLACTPKQLTLAVKLSGYKNFNHFVNTLRVDEAKRLLKSSPIPIIDVAFEAGFNSKPSFNRAFKELTGSSPSEYRRRAEQQTKQPLGPS